MSRINRFLMYCLFWAIVAFFAPTIIKYLLLAASAIIYILSFNLNPPRERQSRIVFVPLVSRPTSPSIANFMAKPLPPPTSAVTPSFHRFMDLPVEQRHCIWEFAELDVMPRIIRIPWKRSESDPARPVVPAPPALMHACHESRQLLQKHYRPLCCTEAVSTPANGSLDPFVWINYDRDICHTAMVAMRNLVSSDLRLHVSRLELVFHPGYSVLPSIQGQQTRFVSDFLYSFRFVHSFPRLREVRLFLIVPSPDEGHNSLVKPWKALSFSIMTEFYATCTPVDFNLLIHGPGGDGLSRTTFFSLLEQVQEIDVRRLPPQLYPLFQRWFTFDNFSDRLSAVWKHVGCSCQDDGIHDDQRQWLFRTNGVK